MKLSISKIRAVFWLFAIVSCTTPFFDREVVAAERPDIGPLLREGKLAEAEQALQEHHGAGDDLAHFQLGAVQVIRAIERLAQDGARYGALNRTMMLPFIRVGGFAQGGAEPEPVTYDNLRQMFERFQRSIVEAEATLAVVKDDQLKWHLNLDEVRLDINGDGQAGERETLGMLFRMISNRGRADQQQAEDLTVGFDSADVYWLRGYCHLLAAMADVILAYDHERLFEVTAHAFFAKPHTEFASKLSDSARANANRQFWDDLPDLIAAIHLMDFKLREPQRFAAAQQHLLQMIEMSRRSWDLIAKEVDNDREWIPSANQQSVIEGLAMNQERIKTWGRFLEEAEQVLKGEKLVPFWRHGFEQDLNLGRVFSEPRDFDLVLWVQGTAAMPYLEEGEKTSPETWREFQRVFRGEFIGFAAWIN
jgi:hypothetical protein